MTSKLRPFLGLFLAPLLAGVTLAAVKTEQVEYKQGSTTLKGFVAYDEAVEGKRPGVLVAPEWWGLDDYAKRRAEQLAEMGYVVLALDPYGDGKSTNDPKEAGEWSGALRNDRALLRERAKAALDELTKRDDVDPKRVAAIGYCFGGMTVLELARSGADVAGVVSFHGSLNTPNPADAKNIKAKILVAHGGADTFVPTEEVEAFKRAMADAGVEAEVKVYDGAVHSFTNPDADKHGIKGVAYDEKADKRSWEDMKAFFAEILGG